MAEFTVSGPPAPLANPTTLGRGLAVLRIFMGMVLFANGLAKLFSFRNVEIGPYRGFLITRGEARGIVNFEVNERDGHGTLLPGLPSLVNDLILPHWNVFQWVVTFTELGVGLLLILGLASRGAGLAGLGFMLFLALVYLSSNRWMFEQPHEYIPMVILTFVPGGRYWGVDGWLLRRGIVPRRWPF